MLLRSRESGGILDEAHPAGPQQGLRLLAPGVGAGRDADDGLAAVAEDEVAEEGVRVPLQAEDGMQAALFRWSLTAR